MQRTKQTFYAKLGAKSHKTLKKARISVENFERFTGESIEQTALDFKSKSKQEVLDHLQTWLNQAKLAPRSKRSYFGYIKKCLRHLGVEITTDDVKDEIDFPEVPKEELHPCSDDELRQILGVCDYKFKVNTVVECSSGIRRGELVQVRKKHFVFGKARLLIKLPPSIAKFGKARTIILSKEAGILVTPKLNKLSDNDLAFAKSENPEFGYNNEQQKLQRCLEKLGLDQRYESNNRHKINTHSFRAWFITKMSRRDKDLAYLLSGQEGYLLSYDRLSDDEKLELYLKYEGDLLIYDDSKRVKEIENTNEKLVDMQRQIDELKRANRLFELAQKE